MTISRIQPCRRMAEALQALLILGIPFFRINGESVLRFDIPSLKLHLFGVSLWMDEFFIVLMAVFLITFLIILVTLLFGRIWCGWICPQTVIIDITWFMDRARSKGITDRAIAYLLTLFVCVLVAADLIWYFVSPYEFIPRLMAGRLGAVIWGFWISLSIILFLNYAFLRHKWCSTACPYSKLQGALFDSSTMVIGFDTRRSDECMDCGACVKACPVDVDIRKGLNAACISCAECIDACAEKLMGKNKKGLIGYFFGRPGGSPDLLRTNAVLIGAVTLSFLICFLYLSLTRSPFDITVMPNNEVKPRITEKGELLNSFMVAAENRSRSEMEFSASADVKGRPLRIVPEKFILGAGEHRRTAVYVFTQPQDQDAIDLSFETIRPFRKRIVKSINIMRPMETR